MADVSAFECWVVGSAHRTVVNAESLGKAKSQFLRHSLYDLDIPFTVIRARAVGAPVTSEDFRRVAVYRGLPNVKCGQECVVSGDRGVIVGHNSSSNFDVLFRSGRYSGQVLNVHPHSIDSFPSVEAR
jgi:hypothetical protein